MENKVAMVTGGGSGIGRATAIAFAVQGTRVAVIDIDDNGGNETVQEIINNGGNATFIHADVSAASEVKTAVDYIIHLYGHLDYAHNNAGVEATGTSIANCSEEDWDRVININLKGVWLCMKYEIPAMLNQGKGAIVNMSSIAGLGAAANASPYIASKHGVIGLTRSAAVEYTKAGIRVNAICPGVVITPLVERLMESDPNANLTQEPIGRLGTPEEIANVVIWLCSDMSSFISGHALVADGGKTILHSA